MNPSPSIVEAVVQFVNGGGGNTPEYIPSATGDTISLIAIAIAALCGIFALVVFGAVRVHHVRIDGSIESSNSKVGKIFALVLGVVAAVFLAVGIASNAGSAIAAQNVNASISSQITATVEEDGGVVFDQGWIKSETGSDAYYEGVALSYPEGVTGLEDCTWYIGIDGKVVYEGKAGNEIPFDNQLIITKEAKTLTIDVDGISATQAKTLIDKNVLNLNFYVFDKTQGEASITVEEATTDFVTYTLDEDPTQLLAEDKAALALEAAEKMQKANEDLVQTNDPSAIQLIKDQFDEDILELEAKVKAVMASTVQAKTEFENKTNETIDKDKKEIQADGWLTTAEHEVYIQQLANVPDNELKAVMDSTSHADMDAAEAATDAKLASIEKAYRDDIAAAKAQAVADATAEAQTQLDTVKGQINAIDARFLYEDAKTTLKSDLDNQFEKFQKGLEGAKNKSDVDKALEGFKTSTLVTKAKADKQAGEKKAAKEAKKVEYERDISWEKSNVNSDPWLSSTQKTDFCGQYDALLFTFNTDYYESTSQASEDAAIAAIDNGITALQATITAASEKAKQAAIEAALAKGEKDMIDTKAALKNSTKFPPNYLYKEEREKIEKEIDDQFASFKSSLNNAKNQAEIDASVEAFKASDASQITKANLKVAAVKAEKEALIQKFNEDAKKIGDDLTANVWLTAASKENFNTTLNTIKAKIPSITGTLSAKSTEDLQQEIDDDFKALNAEIATAITNEKAACIAAARTALEDGKTGYESYVEGLKTSGLWEESVTEYQGKITDPYNTFNAAISAEEGRAQIEAAQLVYEKAIGDLEQAADAQAAADAKEKGDAINAQAGALEELTIAFENRNADLYKTHLTTIANSIEAIGKSITEDLKGITNHADFNAAVEEIAGSIEQTSDDLKKYADEDGKQKGDLETELTSYQATKKDAINALKPYLSDEKAAIDCASVDTTITNAVATIKSEGDDRPDDMDDAKEIADDAKKVVDDLVAADTALVAPWSVSWNDAPPEITIDSSTYTIDSAPVVVERPPAEVPQPTISITSVPTATFTGQFVPGETNKVQIDATNVPSDTYTATLEFTYDPGTTKDVPRKTEFSKAITIKVEAGKVYLAERPTDSSIIAPYKSTATSVKFADEAPASPDESINVGAQGAEDKIKAYRVGTDVIIAATESGATIASGETSLAGFCSGFSNLSSMIDFGNLDMSETKDVSDMLSSCPGLTHVEFPDSFNTANVETFEGMLWQCTNLQYVILGNGFTVTDSSNIAGMFASCTQLTYIYVNPGTTWSAERETPKQALIFNQCTNLHNWDGNYNATHANDDPDTGYFSSTATLKNRINAGQSILHSYKEAKSVEFRQEDSNIYPGESIVLDTKDHGIIKAYKVPDGEGYKVIVASRCKIAVNETTCKSLFSHFSSLTSFDFGGIDFSGAKSMLGMIQWCTSLTEVDLRGQFNCELTNVTDFTYMFEGDDKLETIIFDDKFVVNQTAGLESMFADCKSLEHIYVPTETDWSQATHSSKQLMFKGCKLLPEGGPTDNTRAYEGTKDEVQGYFTALP